MGCNYYEGVTVGSHSFTLHLSPASQGYWPPPVRAGGEESFKPPVLVPTPDPLMLQGLGPGVGESALTGIGGRAQGGLCRHNQGQR